MIRCSEIELLLQDYLDGYLLRAQRAALESHLEKCPSCRSLVSDMRRLEGEMEEVPPVEVPAGLEARILGALPRAPAARARQRVFTPLTALLAAAMVALMVGGLAGGIFGSRLLGGGEQAREVEMVFFSPAAGSVSVIGDFNGWDPGKNPMERRAEDGLWRVRLRLSPGMYQYGFLVDGREWTKDPLAERFVADGFGDSNSILVIDG